MEIVIERFRRREDSLDGWLKINGEVVCDTAECPQNALPVGTYRIELTRCKQHNRRVMRIVRRDVTDTPRCEGCKVLEFVGANTIMPCVCPMITIGNGVRGRADGSVIIGERAAYPRPLPEGKGESIPLYGTILHSTAAYDKLYGRVKKAVQRGKEVVVRVI